MSIAGLHIETSGAFAPETNREKFFRLLLHDNRNSFYFVSTVKEGAWVDIPVRGSHLSSFRFAPGRNYYVTHNGFTGKRRLAENARQLNALFFDIDCHRLASQRERDRAIQAVLDHLGDAILEERFPIPTLIVDTGRGVQLYFVLKRSIPCSISGNDSRASEGVAYFEDTQRRLADALEEILADLEFVDVDRCVFDHSRVGRIPDTFNTKAGKCARLVNACEVYYDLSFLSKFRPSRKEKTAQANRNSQAPKASSRLRFNALMIKRLQNIYDLQAYRDYDCQGTRELMSFVFYNTAVQIYEKRTAVEMLSAFNAKFKRPLPKIELASIASSVNRVVNVKGEKGHYVLNARTLTDLLSLTKQEIQAIGFFSSKREKERLDAKRMTKERRAARNAKIIALGKSKKLTQQQIADEAGCSVRTVHAVLKAAGLTKVISTPSQQCTEAYDEQNRHKAKPIRFDKANKTTAQTATRALAMEAHLKPAKTCQPCLRGSDLLLPISLNLPFIRFSKAFSTDESLWIVENSLYFQGTPLPHLRCSMARNGSFYARPANSPTFSLPAHSVLVQAP